MSSFFYETVRGEPVADFACIQETEKVFCTLEQKKLLDAGFMLVVLSECKTMLFAKSPDARSWFVLESFREKRKQAQGKFGKISLKERFLLRVNSLLENKKIIYLGKKPEGIF